MLTFSRMVDECKPLMAGRSASFAHSRTTSDELNHSSDAATFMRDDGSGDVFPGGAARASEPGRRHTMSELSEGEGEGGVLAGAVTVPSPLPPPVLLAVTTEVGPGIH